MSQKDLNEADAFHRRRIDRSLRELPRLFAELTALPPDADYKQVSKAVDAFQHGCRLAAAARFVPALEQAIEKQIDKLVRQNRKEQGIDYLTVPQKKQMAMWINGELRSRGMSIAHDGKPCTLWAESCPGATPQGHFRLAIGKTVEKTISSKLPNGYFPITLMDAPPRIEGGERWSDRVAETPVRNRDQGKN